MTQSKTAHDIDPERVRAAIKTLSEFGLRANMKQVEGYEPFVYLRPFRAVESELLLVADACEAGMLEVKKSS